MDEELVQLIEEAVPAPQCEVHFDSIEGPQCENVASWMSNASCGHSTYYCDEHHDKALMPLMIALVFGHGAWCPFHSEGLVQIESVAWVKL